MSDIKERLRDPFVNHQTLREAADYIEKLEKDAARWQEARKYLGVDDIEAWYGCEWKGHQSSDEGNKAADRAIDTALTRTKE